MLPSPVRLAGLAVVIVACLGAAGASAQRLLVQPTAEVLALPDHSPAGWSPAGPLLVLGADDDQVWDAGAMADAWPRTLAFLRRTLGTPPR